MAYSLLFNTAGWLIPRTLVPWHQHLWCHTCYSRISCPGNTSPVTSHLCDVILSFFRVSCPRNTSPVISHSCDIILSCRVSCPRNTSPVTSNYDVILLLLTVCFDSSIKLLFNNSLCFQVVVWFGSNITIIHCICHCFGSETPLLLGLWPNMS